MECGGSKTGAQGLECLKQAGLWTTLGTGPSQGLEWGSGTLPSIRPSAGQAGSGVEGLSYAPRPRNW